MEKNKGITLIALVITIIVLLILAGISITLIIGPNGIIQRAQESSGKYNESAKEEEEKMKNLNNEFNQLYENVMDEDDTIYIENKEKFIEMFTKMKEDDNYTVGKKFALKSDIDLLGEDWKVARGLTNFRGVFNGNGYKIKNLVQKTGIGGIFYKNYGTITNLGVDMNCNISPTETMTLAEVSGVANTTFASSIVFINYETGKIEGCWNESNVGSNIGENPLAGGIVGINEGKIQKCYMLGNVIGNHTGSIAATQEVKSIIEDCYTFGTAGIGYSGSIVGYNWNILQNSYTLQNSLLTYGGGGVVNTIIQSRYFSASDRNNQSSVDYLNNGRTDEEAPWTLDTLNVNNGYPVLKGVGLGKVYK